MQRPSPILVADRFRELLDSLLEVLESLEKSDWELATSVPDWTVKDIALHLLGGDIGNLSRRRDRFRIPAPSLETWEGLVAWLNAYNQEWVQSGRRISPRLLCDLLRLVGDQLCAYFLTLDPFALGAPVSWAGPDRAPVWLDIAREFTERWHHQQHIRDAVGKPGLMEERFLAPVLGTFVYGIPQALRPVNAPDATTVSLVISGPAGGVWTVVRENGHWILYAGCPENPNAEVVLPQEVAWRLFTKGLLPGLALENARLRGDVRLCQAVLKTVSIIA